MARSRTRTRGPRFFSPPIRRRYCPGPASPAAPRGRVALRSLPPRRYRKSGRRSLPCSRLHHDVREAASRATAASSGRRRHVFLPSTWPCQRSRWLCPSRLLQVSDAEGRLLLLPAPPLRGRLLEPPGAERSRPIGSLFPPPLPPPLPSSSRSQSRRHLGSPLNSGARGHPGSRCRGGPLTPPFKETGARPRASQRRRPRTEAGGGRGVAEVAGAQGAEEGETLVAPVTAGAPSCSQHAPSCEYGAACACVAPCVRHQPRSGIWQGRGARLRRSERSCVLCPRRARCRAFF
ncbi:serine/arginine repetitive matrix protein 1-like [Phyllostomus discolor]|uniref:Serine/arginine repetitive matrix protein 1-like n=1 Tax=Phyllostomus discolor TaxID=89673 RepID=A0A7E6CQH9_9CHIR|nr:serine/arginine repetitive matrix protein 1-like [Phyllostomus discolor]